MDCPHCGCEIETAKGAPRSALQLRRYFAMIRAAFHHWPESHERQFTSEEECRKWLQMKAGHREVGASIPLTGMSKERAMMLAEAAIRAADAYATIVIHGDTLVVWRPKSIAFNRLGHLAACRLFDEVSDVIIAETGLIPEQLLKEHERAA